MSLLDKNDSRRMSMLDKNDSHRMSIIHLHMAELAAARCYMLAPSQLIRSKEAHVLRHPYSCFTVAHSFLDQPLQGKTQARWRDGLSLRHTQVLTPRSTLPALHWLLCWKNTSSVSGPTWCISLKPPLSLCGMDDSITQ